MHRINPALARLWVTPDTLQFGYPEGVLVTNLRAPKERMLKFLEEGFAPAQLEVLKRIARCSDADCDELIEQVQPLLSDWTTGLGAFNDSRLQLLQPEIHRLLRLGRIPGPILQLRADASLFISDFGNFGSLLLQNLIAVGFSKFVTTDSSLRLPAIDGKHGNVESRLRAIRSRLPEHCQLQLHSLLHRSTILRIDLAVIIEFEVCDPTVLQIWQSYDVPILRVRFGEDGPRVSEIMCHRSESNNDPRWPYPSNAALAGASNSPDAGRQLAIIEAQLAREPRRFESAPEVLDALQQALPKILKFAESIPRQPESRQPSHQVEKSPRDLSPA